MAKRKVFKGGEFLIDDVEFKDVFTPEDLNEEHRMFFATALKFVKNDVMPHIEKLEAKDFELHKKIHAMAGELGFLGTDVQEEYGGLGLDKVSTTCVGDALGRVGSYGVTYGAHTGIGILPLVYFGNHDQKSRYLPQLSSGEWAAASCLTEAGAGSDALSVRTKAVKTEDGEHYILNGEKIFITNAGFSELFVVYTKVDGEHFTCFLVEKDSPGLTLGPEEKKMGGHGSSTTTVSLEDVKVPAANLLFEIGKGHKIAFNCLNLGRLKLGAGCTGASKQCITQAAAYAVEREQFGKPIASFGMIKEKLADMTIRAYISESIQYRVAGMIDDNLDTLDEEEKKSGETNAKFIGEYATECSIAKIYGSETLDYCADEYVQILGGYGYSAEYPAERIYRDSRINRIWEGTNEVNRLLVPGTMMKRAMQGRLDLLGAAKQVTDFIMTYMPLAVELPDTPLATQEHMVKMAKKIALMASGLAAMKFGAKLTDEQEVLAILADILIEIFAMESGILRAQKYIEAKGEEKAEHQIAAVKVYVDETVPQIEQWAKKLAAYVEEGDMLRNHFAAIKKLARYTPANIIALKKKIADRVIALEDYPFFEV